MIKIDKTFSASYSCNLLPVFPAGNRIRYYYPGATTRGGRDGMIVEIVPGISPAWIGVFAFGEAALGQSSIHTSPQPEHVCVVSRGQGYFVDAENPKRCSLISIFPIFGVYPSLTDGILLFADHTRLAAYDSSGQRWISERLSWDGFRDITIRPGTARGEGWDASSESYVSFEIDLRTGARDGGIEFPTSS